MHSHIRGSSDRTNNATGEPAIQQVFIVNTSDEKVNQDDFERRLYVLRKSSTSTFRQLQPDCDSFYFCSLSSKTIVYKGQLTSEQFCDYYLDLQQPDYESHIAIAHSRFSTNTFPSWARAQPNRFTCHNGEINTVRGNKNWMRAREAQLKSELFGEDLKKLFPITAGEISDSACFDLVLELLVLSGRSLPGK